MANLDDSNVGVRVFETFRSFLFDRDGYVMALSIYMDESNTHDGTDYLTVSTAWAKPRVWADWSKDWAEKIKPLNNYHSVDVHNREGECEGWSRPRRDALVIRCLPTFAKHNINGAVACIDRKRLAKGLARRPGIMREVGHEYLIAFIFAVGNALGKLNDDSLSFFHEENQWSGKALYHFAKLKKRYNRPNATLSFGSKTAWPPLQCADVYAYEGYQQLNLDPTMTNVRRTWQAINVAKDKIIVNALIADDKITDLLAETLIDWFDRKGLIDSLTTETTP
ncbi:MAG: hypothetical protein WCE69_15385 [Aestuariivirga sp.]